MSALATIPHRMTLRQMPEEYLRLLAALEEVCEEGELKDDASNYIQEQLAIIEQQLPAKIDGTLAVVNELERFADHCRQEADRLQTRSERWANQSRWLKGRILEAMQTMGIPKLKTPTNTVAVVKNGGKRALQLPEHIDFIPPEYLTTRTITEPDKEKIREALESGTPELKTEVSLFASLAERGVHLRIS